MSKHLDDFLAFTKKTVQTQEYQEELTDVIAHAMRCPTCGIRLNAIAEITGIIKDHIQDGPE